MRIVTSYIDLGNRKYVIFEHKGKKFVAWKSNREKKWLLSPFLVLSRLMDNLWIAKLERSKILELPRQFIANAEKITSRTLNTAQEISLLKQQKVLRIPNIPEQRDNELFDSNLEKEVQEFYTFFYNSVIKKIKLLPKRFTKRKIRSSLLQIKRRRKMPL